MTTSPIAPEPRSEHRPQGPVVQGELVPVAQPYGMPQQHAGLPQHAPLHHQAPLHPGQVQPYAAPAAYGPPPVMMMAAPKSVGVTFVLTFFFGVLGMFYATTSGALILLGVTLGAIVLAVVVIGILSVLTLGFGAALFAFVPLIGVAAWITSMIWGCMAASRHNERLAAQYAAAGYRPPGY